MIVSPWVRDLKTGIVRRYLNTKHVAAAIVPHGDIWKWHIPHDGIFGLRSTPEKAKVEADRALRELGYIVVDAPTGCIMEEK